MDSVIALTTDFGLSDHFAGTMKGVMLNINPALRFVDISHQVPFQSVFDGAVTLSLAYPYFPPGTIHLVIVDPGVGSARRAIIARAAGQFFVAPDNGVLSLVFKREPGAEVWHVTADRYFLKPVSNTFHGRDIFAPVAAWLSKGTKPESFGPAISDWITIDFPLPARLPDGSLRAEVIKVDQFGNLITNLSAADAPALFAPGTPKFTILINQREITRRHTSYAMGAAGELFTIAGSSGFVEIAQNRSSAAAALGAKRGTELVLRLS